MKPYFIAFWNLENLFDIENSPRRSDKLKRAIGKDLKGWDEPKLSTKIDQLSKIIKLMNNGLGPDILGVCEIENKHVLERLVVALASLSRNYKIVHADTKDQRGIDVAIIYDADMLEVEQGNIDTANPGILTDLVFNHFVMRRTATRDILQVNFLTKVKRNRIIVMVNHWPSRSGGEYESQGYRFIAGETLAYFHQRIMEEHGEDTAVISLGDYNDEPHNLSLTQYALSNRSRTKVVMGNNAYFYNLMWDIIGDGNGSFFFENSPNMLDQILVNENVIKKTSVFQIKHGSVKVEKVTEMTNPGTYKKPIPFGGMGKDPNVNGYSDHFPVSVVVVEK